MTPCTVEARYWREGPRWQIVLQVMYWTNATERAAGTGPYFVIGHAWRRRDAEASTREANDRLALSEDKALNWATRANPMPISPPPGFGIREDGRSEDAATDSGTVA